MRYHIREITQDDIEKCKPLIQEFFEEVFTELKFSFDSDYYTHFAQTVVGPHSFLIEVDGIIVGVLAGSITPTIISGEMVYVETVWYMGKQAGRRYGLKLFNHVEEYCKQVGIKKMIFALMGTTLGEKVERFYKRIGFQLLEKHFIKEVG